MYSHADKESDNIIERSKMKDQNYSVTFNTNMMAKQKKPSATTLNPEPTKTITCDGKEIRLQKLNALLNSQAAGKHFYLDNCVERENCDCHTDDPSKQKVVDLVVLIDTSGSLSPEYLAVDEAVKSAIDLAKRNCEVDLRIEFFGVNDIWAGTVFNQSHSSYLQGIHGASIFLKSLNSPGLSSELGAKSIEDLSEHMDWREKACRAIFYISDEELSSVRPKDDYDYEDQATLEAIDTANNHNVSVFAHHITNLNQGPRIEQNYRDLCDQTGGKVFFSDTVSVDDYTNMLAEIICKGCGVNCPSARIPVYEPCISIKYGDGKKDQLETEDIEVLTVSVKSCYANLGFNNFRIGMLSVVKADGTPVDKLPDGTPAVKVYPLGPVCFGDIPACDEEGPQWVTREIVMVNRSAKPGKYLLQLSNMTYNVCFCYSKEECYEFELYES